MASKAESSDEIDWFQQQAQPAQNIFEGSYKIKTNLNFKNVFGNISAAFLFSISHVTVCGLLGIF